MTIYGEALARAHDNGWRGFAESAAPGVVARLRAAGIDRGLVVSLACGSGILERVLVDAGYDVLGIDLSADMLAIARRRVPEAEFVQASVLDAALPACAAVIAAGEGLGYMADERMADGPPLRALFARVRTALEPGGLFLFDLVEQQAPSRAWHEGDGYVLAVDGAVDGGVLTRNIIVFTRDGDTWRRSDETHRARLQRREDVLADLRAAGFDAETFTGYADAAPLRPGVVGYVARSPQSSPAS